MPVILYFTLFLSPVGTIDNSPPIYRWVDDQNQTFSPEGTSEHVGWACGPRLLLLQGGVLPHAFCHTQPNVLRGVLNSPCCQAGVLM